MFRIIILRPYKLHLAPFYFVWLFLFSQSINFLTAAPLSSTQLFGFRHGLCINDRPI
jgi:hypothetical protein